ncbi:hypothetical protein A2110_02775 [Candidatus Jorgensenbacteria bacterium GWA1_54_12]|uniref:Vitamin K epoxide reductase domain-containing protein n=1 Tax=Candidatus Jorgensenbacteria bacterium GWA1_54_12 TaxID=1798468 RepID=A0A1F6BKN5_9BACT|nr:MAG: hypothetical protein A2110_02775 [Candidatus Jorgensenbacteria bacterium GWA1_54_12]
MTVPYALIFTIAALGISETAYLVKKRRLAEKPVCLIGEDCGVVLTSKWSKMFGIPNDILGFVFYVSIAIVTAFLVIGIEPLAVWDRIMKIMIAFGAGLSVFFTYLQWRVIKAWCLWCLMSAVTTWLMGAILLISGIR